MPNSSGIDLLKRVRSESRFKNLPFLLVTAEAEKTQVTEAIQSGVSGYVVKPFTPESLKEKLQAVFKKHFGG
jgi:two-component system chemotaxis response regulator CheY